VAEAVGTAVGLAILLRGVPAAAADRLSYIPSGVASAAGVTSRATLLAPPSAAAAPADGAAAVAAYRVVGEAAASRLAAARAAVAAAAAGTEGVALLPRAVAPAAWGGVGAGLYLDWLRDAGWDPWAPALRRRVEGVYPARLGVALLRRRLFGGF